MDRGKPTYTLEDWYCEIRQIPDFNEREPYYVMIGRQVGMIAFLNGEPVLPGEIIYTSPIQSFDAIVFGDRHRNVVETMNSNYVLGTPA